MLITFSGLDGSGKSTLISKLECSLIAVNLRVRVLTMYDDVSFYAYIRNVRIFVKKLMGIETEDTVKPLENYTTIPQDPKTGVTDKKGTFVKLLFKIARNKHVKKGVLLLDLFSLLMYRCRHEFFKKEILIIDRYLYDSIVDAIDLDKKNHFSSKLFTRLAPEPDIPFLIDVPEGEAFRRKQEFPINYMKWRRATYKMVFGWIKDPVIMKNDNLAEAISEMNTIVYNRLK